MVSQTDPVWMTMLLVGGRSKNYDSRKFDANDAIKVSRYANLHICICRFFTIYYKAKKLASIVTHEINHTHLENQM